MPTNVGAAAACGNRLRTAATGCNGQCNDSDTAMTATLRRQRHCDGSRRHSSTAMALLRRLLALSCDRHMRNATAVSALICGMCEGEGSCSCWSLERKAASSVCWQPAIDCRPSAGCSSEPMALLRRLLALSCDRHMRNATAVSALAYAVVVLLAARRRCCAVCWPSHAIGTCEMPARAAAAAGLASERLSSRPP